MKCPKCGIQMIDKGSTEMEGREVQVYECPTQIKTTYKSQDFWTHAVVWIPKERIK